MPDQVVQISPDSSGKKIDVTELTVSAQTVERQRINIADSSAPAGLAVVGNTAPGASDYGLEVRNIPADVTSSPANLTTAGNGAAFAVTGYPGVSLNITGSPVTFVFKAQISVDGGTTWTDTYLQQPSGLTASTFAVNGQYSIELTGGVSHVRVVLNSIVSGTFTYQYRASMTLDPDQANVGPTGSAVPPVAALFGASDGTNLQAARTMTTQPVGTEQGIVMRPASSFPDTTVGSTVINGSGQTVQIALSGQVGLAFQLQSGGTLVSTITPQLSVDGGTTWFNTYMEIPGTSQVIATANTSSGQSTTVWQVVPCAGASHARLLASGVTGSGTFIARAAQIFDDTDEDAGPDNTGLPPVGGLIAGSDGTNIRFLRCASTSPTGSEVALIARTIPRQAASYAASTNGTVAVPVTASTTTSIAYLWHPSTVTKRYEVYRIDITTLGPTTASTAGQLTTLRLAKISGEAGTPGGTSQTVNPLDAADSATGGTFRTAATGAPTRAAGDFKSWQVQTVATNAYQTFVWDASTMNEGRPLISRASQNEGWEIRAITNGTAIGTGGVTVSVDYHWKEI